MSMHFEESFMRRAIALAKENVDKGGGPFGAVLVCDGQVIAEATNQVVPSTDPTAHAEVNAIRMACRALGSIDLSSCVLYSSCEPCPMCLAASYWAHLGKIYFAASRFDAQQSGFDDELIYRELSQDVSSRSMPMEQKCENSGLEPFFYWRDFENKIRY